MNKQGYLWNEEDKDESLQGDDASLKRDASQAQTIETDATKRGPDLDQKITEDMLERRYKRLQEQARSQQPSQQSRSHQSSGRDFGSVTYSHEGAGAGRGWQGNIPAEKHSQSEVQLRRQAQEVIWAAETNIRDELIDRENDCIVPRSSPPVMHVDEDLHKGRHADGEVFGQNEDIDEASSSGIGRTSLAVPGPGEGAYF